MRLPRLLTSLAFLITPAYALTAQIRASEPASVSQTVDGTTLTIEYSRPRARGRDSLFGGIIPWGEVWTPGANAATTFEVSRDITLDGHPVPKGKYSVWMDVEPGDWTLVLDPRTNLFHTQHPTERDDQIRFTLERETRPPIEVLTWWFPAVGSTGGTLAMQWGNTYVPLQFEVPPSHDPTLAAELAPRYVGSWEMTDAGPAGRTSSYEVYYQDGRLQARLRPAPFPEMENQLLIRIKDDWFIMGLLQNGEIFDVMDDVLIEFSGDRDGKAAALEVRGEDDQVWARGRRKS
ncbi:MAG: DUF2911 domain-containing protein [Gemmatimonadales bacterium]